MADIINKALYSFLSKLNRPCIILLLIYAHARLNFLIFLKSWHLSYHSWTHSINENIIKKNTKQIKNQSYDIMIFLDGERILITARARAGNFPLRHVRPFKKVSGKFLENRVPSALRCESHTFVTESS